ncbi:MAG: hypothetical protein ABW026_14390 [Microvirga sp.]
MVAEMPAGMEEALEDSSRSTERLAELPVVPRAVLGGMSVGRAKSVTRLY